MQDACKGKGKGANKLTLYRQYDSFSKHFGYQLSAISYQLSAVSCKLQAVSCKLEA
jgi:hypothetical protein